PLDAEKGSQRSAKGSHPRTEMVARCDPNHQEPSQEPSFPGARDARRRMAARRRARETNPGRFPDPLVAEWLDLFCLAHEQTIGTKYLVRGARDGAHLKRALATHDEATIQRALVEYFADPSARRKYGASVPLFVDRIATLASARRPRL